MSNWVTLTSTLPLRAQAACVTLRPVAAAGSTAPMHQLVTEILRDLVRMDTTNPPGNELACARYLADLLTPAGIEARIIEPAPGRGNLIARWRGAGESRPLMLMGHLDVVAADAHEWKRPPFEGTIEHRYLWGRGATDNKQMVAIAAAILLALAGEGRRLKRDIVLAATADEEKGGRYGMGWLAQREPEILQVACALNEGGGSAMRVGERLFYTCQTAEKGVCRTVWTARSASGHASQPRRDLATFKLARALAQLGDGHLGGRVIDTMRRAVTTIATEQSAAQGRQVDDLLAQGRIEEALGEAGFSSENAALCRALFYDTASPTVLAAGDLDRINVIPSAAQAYVDGRILPGETMQGFVARLQGLAGDEVAVELHENQFSPGLESPADAPIVDVIRQVIAERADGAAVVPWQCAGSTDAKHLIPRGVPVYGFIPAKPPPEGAMAGGAHAVDEGIWLESLAFGYEVLYDVTRRYGEQSD